MIPLVDLRAQYWLIKPEIDAAVQGVLSSGRFIMGENVSKFESEFASYCGSKFGVGVNSGTDALFLSLEALGIGPGDEVIVPAFTFVATMNSVIYTGAAPITADVDPMTYTIDAGDLKRKITPRTKAVIPVHLYGQAADMGAVMEQANEHGLYVVEDAAQAHGAEYRGEKAGSIGTTGCFSFYPSKNLGAYGDGGMVVTRWEELAEKIRALGNYGQKRKYEFSTLGYNSRLDEIQAAILRVKLKYLDGWVTKRRTVAKIYTGLLSEYLGTPWERVNSKHAYHIYAVRCRDRDGLRGKLALAGVETGIHYPAPLGIPSNHPVAEELSREVLSLPMFPELTNEEVSAVTEAVKEALKNN